MICTSFPLPTMISWVSFSQKQLTVCLDKILKAWSVHGLQQAKPLGHCGWPDRSKWIWLHILSASNYHFMRHRVRKVMAREVFMLHCNIWNVSWHWSHTLAVDHNNPFSPHGKHILLSPTTSTSTCVQKESLYDIGSTSFRLPRREGMNSLSFTWPLH